MASQLLGIKTRFTDDLGSPLVGGQVYTYFAGTSTNQDSYSDAALTVPNTNPVILDDTGSADIFLKGSYRIRVFDASGRFIEEQDNVSQPSSSTDVASLTGRVITVEEKTSMIGVVYNTLSTETAKLLNIKDDVTSIRTQRFSDVDKGGALYARSTALEVEPHSPLAWFQTADGAYWLLNEANPTPEMFGAKGDLKYQLVLKGDLIGENADNYGHRYLSGTNDIEAFNAAMQYAKIKGCEKVSASGDYFIQSYSRLSSNTSNNYPIPYKYRSKADIEVYTHNPAETVLELQKRFYKQSEFTIIDDKVVLNTPLPLGVEVNICQGFKVYGKLEINGVLWTKYNLVNQGVYGTSHSHYKCDLTIGQLQYTPTKSGNSGDYGAILGSGSGYYKDYDHVQVVAPIMETQLIRAGYFRGDTANGIAYQDSDSSLMVAGMGNLYGAKFIVDAYDAATNVVSLMLVLLHWGGRYVPPTDGSQESSDKTPYPIIKSWHPEECEIIHTQPLRNSQHGFDKGFEFASTINCKCSDITVDGGEMVYGASVGDLGGAFAVGEQKGRVNTGNEIGFVTGFNIASELYAVLLKGSGTSKFETYPNMSGGYPNNALLRNDIMDLNVKGHTIYCKDVYDVIRVQGLGGAVDLGVSRLYGGKKALYAYDGYGELSIDLVDSDCMIHCRGISDLTFKRTGVNLGSSRNFVAGSVDESALFNNGLKGYEANNAAVVIEGFIGKTTLVGSFAQGATEIKITPFDNSAISSANPDPSSRYKISPNDVLRITNPDGSQVTTRATGFTKVGADRVYVESLTGAIQTGAVVALELICRVKYLNLTHTSSEYGLWTRHTRINELDMSNAHWSGRHHAFLQQSIVNIVGKIPSDSTRAVVATSTEAVWADEFTFITAIGIDVPKNNGNAASFYLKSSGNYSASLAVTGGRIEDAANFVSATDKLTQVSLLGVADYFGKPINNDYVTGNNTNGYYRKYKNGTLECWARNRGKGTGSPAEWVFPLPFALNSAVEQIQFSVQPSNIIRLQSAGGIVRSNTRAEFEVYELDGTAASSGVGVNLYAKGFWK